MKQTSFFPLILVAASLAACGGSSSDPVTPTDQGIPVGDKGKMHYVHSETKEVELRAQAVQFQNQCVGSRQLMNLPTVDPITIDMVDPRVGVESEDQYLAADRMATYRRYYNFETSVTCEPLLREVVKFESMFADGRSINWSRTDGVYSNRVEDVQDIAALKALVAAMMDQGGFTFPGSTDDLSKIRVATGQVRWIDGVKSHEYKFPGQKMTIWSAQVSDPVPMMGAADQDNLTLATQMLGTDGTLTGYGAVDSTATQVKLSIDLDPSLFDPKSL